METKYNFLRRSLTTVNIKVIDLSPQVILEKFMGAIWRDLWFKKM